MVWNFLRAEDETRTRDPNLGKVVLYQLSYFRICLKNYSLFGGAKVIKISFPATIKEDFFCNTSDAVK